MDVLVSKLTEEESNELGLAGESDECRAAAIRFVNLPIPDRCVPPDRDKFLRSVQELAELVREGRFIGVHCRASIGRSSVLAVSVLIQLGVERHEGLRRGCVGTRMLDSRHARTAPMGHS